MISMQNHAIKLAQKHQEEIQREHVRQSTPKETLTYFQPGEYVLCDYPTTAFGKQQPKKLLTAIRGPFRVIKYDEARQHYVLEHLNEQRTFNIDPAKVRKFDFDPNDTYPARVALSDRQEFYVKAIHGVKENPQRKRFSTFLFEWEGYEEQMWERWSHLRHNSILQQYLSKSGDKTLRNIAKKMLNPSSDQNK